jgi:hypothetical protein
MIEYIKFWLAQAIVEFLIAFTTIGGFLLLLLGLAWLASRK